MSSSSFPSSPLRTLCRRFIVCGPLGLEASAFVTSVAVWLVLFLIRRSVQAPPPVHTRVECVDCPLAMYDAFSYSSYVLMRVPASIWAVSCDLEILRKECP